LNKLQALYNQDGQVQFVNYKDVSSVVDRVFTENSIRNPITDIIIVFLGIDETHGKGENGEAYWALDLTPQGAYENEYTQLIKGNYIMEQEKQFSLKKKK
jgi:NAD+ diphosphatase